jgi:hypothetical protein
MTSWAMCWLTMQVLRDKLVVPLAFIPDQLQQLIPAVIEGVLRARTVQEMVTTWPDQRDSIMENLLFRWTTTLDPEEQGGDDGEQTTS